MKQLFKRFGATDKEAQTFLKMLELGAQPVSVIAKYMHTPRSSMYLILERLKLLQLIEEFERGGIKYAKCIPVKNLKDILKINEKRIQQTTEILDEKLPELEKLENRMSITPTIKFFEGKEEIMQMYEEILKEKEFSAAFNPKIVKEILPEYHFKIPETLKMNKGKARELVVDGAEAHEYQQRYNSSNHQIKILPKKTFFDSDMVICKYKVYLTGYGQGQVSGIEIFNPSLAHAQKALFDLLWDTI